MLVGVYLLWREGCVGFWAHILCLLPLLGLGVTWAKALIFLSSPCFPFLCLWAFWLLIMPYHFVMPAVALPLFLLLVTPMGLWTNASAVPAHFFINLLLKTP